MFNGFVTQQTIDSFLTEKRTPTHRAMVNHFVDFLKRDPDLSDEERLEISRLVISKNKGRKKKSKIVIMTKQELDKMSKNARLSTPFQTERFKLMMRWQYGTGMRISELCGLKFKDLGYPGRSQFFSEGRDKFPYQKILLPAEIAKNNKERFVWVKTETYLAYFDFLKRWMKIDLKAANKIYNNQCSMWKRNKKKYSSDFREQYFKTLGLHLPKMRNTHILRHSRATHLIEDGMPLMQVKEYLGHDSIKTTEKYLHLAENLVEKNLNNIDSI